MSTLFSLLLLLAVVALFLGMLSPRLVLVWGESKTRLRVIKVYGLLLILSAILISVTSSPKVEEGSSPESPAKCHGVNVIS